LRRAYETGADKEAREGMSFASLCGGMALANAALGAVHGFAGPLGGMLHAPHGALCARFLPLVIESNIEALQSRQAEHPSLKRYEEIAEIVTGDQTASAKDCIAWTKQLVADLKIPRLSDYGMRAAQFPEVIEKTLKASSFKGNPIPLSENELRQILQQAL
jgi:alcohol dehydrogenase class IV